MSEALKLQLLLTHKITEYKEFINSCLLLICPESMSERTSACSRLWIFCFSFSEFALILPSLVIDLHILVYSSLCLVFFYRSLWRLLWFCELFTYKCIYLLFVYSVLVFRPFCETLRLLFWFLSLVQLHVFILLVFLFMFSCVWFSVIFSVLISAQFAFVCLNKVSSSPSVHFGSSSTSTIHDQSDLLYSYNSMLDTGPGVKRVKMS